MAQLHADRGDSYGGGDAAGLDYDAYEKPKFENNVMPGTVKALYLNNEAIRIRRHTSPWPTAAASTPLWWT